MMRVAVILLAFFALSVPAVLQAQEAVFTAAVVADRLAGFGEEVLRSACFADRQDPRRLRFALAEMAPSTKFSRQEESRVSDWIAKSLERDFQFDERRLRGTLDQIMRELGEQVPSAGGRLDGFIALWPDPDVRNVNVIAFKAGGQRCVTRSFLVGKISEAPVPDVPERFFERAARKLPERNVEVVVMTPHPVGFDNVVIRAEVMGRKLQAQFVDAINDVLHGNPLIQPGDPARPVAHASDGKDGPGAWQARLSLTSDLPQGVKVRIDYFGPGGRPTGIYDNGYFAPDALPPDSDPEVAAATEAACSSVRQALETVTDPDALRAVARKNECPRLRKDVVEKSAAAELGALNDGQTIERSDRVDGDAAVWKFQLTAGDTIGVQLGGLSENLDVDLRDSSWRIIARPRQGGPPLKEIETTGRAGMHYIRIAPADGRRGSAYTLRVARGALDTAGDTPATARDLGLLGPGLQTISERVGGSDRGDVFKFTVREPMLLKLTLGDQTADVRLDVLSQGPQDSSPQVIRLPPGRPGREPQNIELNVDPRPAYYIAVRPAGQSTPYSLGIALAVDPEAVRRAARFEQMHRAWQALRANHASDNPEDRRRLQEALGQIQPSDKAGLQPEQTQELDAVEAFLGAWAAGTVEKWQEFLDQHRRDEVTALAQHERDAVARRTASERFRQMHAAWQALQESFPLDRSDDDRASLETAVGQIDAYETSLTPDQKRELGAAREFLGGWRDGTIEKWRSILDRSRDRSLTAMTQARLCDLQAASPHDANKAASVPGTPHRQAQSSAATAACSAAARAYPKALRFQYQQARTMETSDPQGARKLHERLCWPSCDYPAACDNLGNILYYRTSPRDQAGAIKALEKGEQCRDPDAMLSLADAIDEGWYTPWRQDKDSRKCQLLREAGRLINLEDVQQQAERTACQFRQEPPLPPGSQTPFDPEPPNGGAVISIPPIRIFPHILLRPRRF